MVRLVLLLLGIEYLRTRWRGLTALGWVWVVAGVVIAVLAVAALAAFAVWEEWLNLIVGLWTLIAPWVLGFQVNRTAMTVHVVVGILVAVLAAIEIWIMSQNPPRLTASR